MTESISDQLRRHRCQNSSAGVALSPHAWLRWIAGRLERREEIFALCITTVFVDEKRIREKVETALTFLLGFQLRARSNRIKSMIFRISM